jgi:hypothetical protein
VGTAISAPRRRVLFGRSLQYDPTNFRLLLTSGLGGFAAFHMAELRFARLF